MRYHIKKYSLLSLATEYDDSFYDEKLFNMYVSTDAYNQDIGINGNLVININSDRYLFKDEYTMLQREQKLKRILNENN